MNKIRANTEQPVPRSPFRVRGEVRGANSCLGKNLWIILICFGVFMVVIVIIFIVLMIVRSSN